MNVFITSVSAVSMAIAVASPIKAQPLSQALGEFEYLNSCATCHGADGKGNGSISGYLNTALPDLSKLQANNGGVFPVSMVYQIIEGGPDAGPHGTRDMPAWGLRYRMRAEGDPDFMTGSEEYARLRILALIEYLSTLQEN